MRKCFTNICKWFLLIRNTSQMAKTRACSVGDASVCILVSSESLFLKSSRASGHHKAEIGEKGVIWEMRE